MPEPRILRNAPITEAVIDLRVTTGAGFSFEDLEDAARHLAPQYPQREELRMREFLVEFAQETEKLESTRRGPVGLRLATPDGKRIVQVRRNGLTYSWLRPYSTWTDLRAAAKQAWDVYAERVQPERIVRVAVRYINRIVLPLPIDDLLRLLPASPDLPSSWPQILTSYLTRVGMRDEQSGDQAIVTQTSEQGAAAAVMNFLLDIDCFHDNPPLDNRGIWEHLDRLRVLKNRIFFSSVTEELLKRFE